MEVIETTGYKKDFKRCRKQGKDLNKLYEVLEKLVNEISLDAKYKDHQLKGELKDYRECHLSPNWLLVISIYEKRRKAISCWFRKSSGII